MGDQNINRLESESRSNFLRALLNDIQALELMISEGRIESGVSRIGAEQEVCLIGNDLRPAMTGPQLLQQANDPNLTSELAKWNLEINLDPQDLTPGCFQRMHRQLDDKLRLIQGLAKKIDNRVLLTGILPTIRKSELDFQNMTPIPRFKIIDSILKQLRGEEFSLYIEGVDEINLKHDSIAFEACNTSYQVHLQVDPSEFADQYNWSQVLAGPVLAISTNSPMLFGKELWSETRIALFRQSIEIRHAESDLQDRQPRVAFGRDWLKSSAVEVFQNDVAFYKLIIGAELEEENAIEQLRNGITPKLRAMNLHNGTLYKWNRACYGVNNNVPHLRIENRYIPAGPTPVDEMANAVFWIGLMLGMPDEFRGQWDRHFYFQEVRSNFLKAARNGLSNKFFWFGDFWEARELILEKLLPIAIQGLQSMGIESSEYTKYLSVIEKRALFGHNGASWYIESFRKLREKFSVDESILMITKELSERCLEEIPVHQWPVVDHSKLVFVPGMHDRVDSIMITRLVIVVEDDLVLFAQRLMEWNEFHHLPVENDQGEITGMISSQDIDALEKAGGDIHSQCVKDCMSHDVISVSPESSVDEAVELMDKHQFRSLPVVRDNKVIGIVTANDIARLESRN